FKTLGSGEQEPEQGFEVETVILGPDQVAGWLSAMPEGRAGLAFRGSYGSGTGRVDAIAVASPDGTAAHLDPAKLTEADEAALRAWLADESRPKAAHDVKGPLLALWAQGLDLRGLTCDTALAAYLAMPGQRTFALEDLARRYLHRELRAEEEPNGQAALFGDDDDAPAKDLALRAHVVRELTEALEAFLSGRGGTHLLTDVELPLLTVLAVRDRAGNAADHQYFTPLCSVSFSTVKPAV